jgi:DNA repair protein RadD
MELRDYQLSAVDRSRKAMLGGARRVCLVGPTGSGKTVIASHIIRRSVELGRRVMFIAHRRELIFQCSAKLVAYGVPHGVVMAGEAFDPGMQVQVGSIQTISRRLDRLCDVDLLFVDECHHARSSQYSRVIERWPDAAMLGLTATPCRLDGKHLGDLFNALVETAPMSQLVADGYIVPERIFAPHVPSMAGVKIKRGDFDLGQLDLAMNQVHIVGDVVKTWMKLGRGRPTIAFAVNVNHSRHMVDSFAAAGVRARHIDANTPKDVRASVLSGLASGAVEVVSNVGILTEGFDSPVVSCAIMARPTASLGLHLQCGGRVLRPAPGKKDALILDHTGNCLRFGTFTEDREWSLTRKQKRRINPRSSRRLRTCEVCYALVSPSKHTCPECGYEFRTAPTLVRTRDGHLVEVPKDVLGRLKSKRSDYQRQKIRTWISLELLRKRNGYAPGWSKFRFKNAHGHWPTKELLSIDVKDDSPV